MASPAVPPVNDDLSPSNISGAAHSNLESRVSRIERYLRLDSPERQGRTAELEPHADPDHPSHALHLLSRSATPSRIRSPLHLDSRHHDTHLERDSDIHSGTGLNDAHHGLSASSLSGRTSHLRNTKERLEQTRYSLGPLGQASYHGETSLFDDFGSGQDGTPTAEGDTATNSNEQRKPGRWKEAGSTGLNPHEQNSLSLLRQTEEAAELAEEDRLKIARQSQHRYASAEEGEAYMNAHFCWASMTYSVISRKLFYRELCTLI